MQVLWLAKIVGDYPQFFILGTPSSGSVVDPAQGEIVKTNTESYPLLQQDEEVWNFSGSMVIDLNRPAQLRL